MKLRINGIEVECILGERPEERLNKQRITVDLTLELMTAAELSDELKDTVDYVVLSEEVRRVLIEAKCKMLERAARLVVEAVKDKIELENRRGAVKLFKVAAEVTKVGAIKGIHSASASYDETLQK